MMTSSIDNLSTSIADGSAGLSDYLTALMSVGFAIPSIISGITSIAKAL
jgi:hypothetical protein